MHSVKKRPVFSALICIGAIVGTGAPVFFMQSPPTEAFAVAAVFPPWWSDARVRSAVDPVGAISSTGRISTVVTVYGGADLRSQLRNAGAWLVLNPQLTGCGQRQESAA